MLHKKTLAVLLLSALFLLAGCRKTETADTTEPSILPQNETVTFYLPDDTATYLVPTPIELEPADDMAPVLVDTLIEKGALPEGTAVNSAELTEKEMKLDLNQAFADALSETGSTGEFLYMTALTNTFLDYYNLDSLTVTAEGQTIETGHAVYDEPFTQLSGLNMK